MDSAGNTFARFDVIESFSAVYRVFRPDLSHLFLEATEGLNHVRHTHGYFVECLELTDKDVNVAFAD